jgi:hypothetical protein
MIEELEGFYKTIRESAPYLERSQRGLEEERRAGEQKEQQARRHERSWSLLINLAAGLVVAALFALGGYFLGRQHEAQSPAPPDISGPSQSGESRP